MDQLCENRSALWRRFRRARTLYCNKGFGVDLTQTVYALDATTIDLCPPLFPWAPFRSAKAAVKLYTLLDLRGNIPSFIHISDGKMGDVSVLDRLLPTDRRTGIICDQRIALDGFYVLQDYPEQLRRIRFKDPESGKTLAFLTNHTALPALTIAALYKSRWQVELFFRRIKQHLRIKRFIGNSGNSENVVKTQIWCAIATIVLIAIVKKELLVMPRSTHCYRFCRSLFLRKPRYLKPLRTTGTLQNKLIPLTN